MFYFCLTLIIQFLSCAPAPETIVHSTRYSLDAAPANLIQAVAEQPFSDDLNSPKWQYYKFLTNLAL